MQLQTPDNETCCRPRRPGSRLGRPGSTGNGKTIAVIDTGIDYPHANFGGPGTGGATRPTPKTTVVEDPPSFGANAPKVIAGWDFAGDAYDAAGETAPRPSPAVSGSRFAHCVYTDGSNGHGSHVSGIATGYGVPPTAPPTAGPTTRAPTPTTSIGPGVAPEADLYAFRVFGCEGSIDLTTEAIQWVAEKLPHRRHQHVVGSAIRPKGTHPRWPHHQRRRGSVVTSAGKYGPSRTSRARPGTAMGAIAYRGG